MPHAETYLETRQHELRKMRMVMVDGNLTTNLRSVHTGASARAQPAPGCAWASPTACDDRSIGGVHIFDPSSRIVVRRRRCALPS